MMRKLFFAVVTLFLLCSCSSELMPACYREAGNSITVVQEVPFFEQINISEGVELVVQQGTEISVTLSAGENVMDEMETRVSDNILYVKNNLECSLGTVQPVKATVTVPDLKKIYSASQFNVSSNGVLNFPELTLQQGLYGKTASNIFTMEVNCQQLVVENNNTTIFRIRGNAENVVVNFYGGDPRFEGGNLEANNIQVFQRSSNDMILKPLLKVEGDIYSNGNLVLLNHPETVNVTQHYTGHIVYP
ncbi:head GIN domain-containing protein [Flavobacterium suncheonense]|uniref:head GIN domain-containing protein n=1 Tax=Flavobacterium suncheonense TaxID=350894 RepID=UPI003FA3ADA0